MLLFLFMFGLALGAVSPSDAHQVKLQRGACPMFWYSFNGRCYKEGPGLDSVTSTRKDDGCGLMGLQWTFPFGPEDSQTTLEDVNTVDTSTLAQIGDGMTISAIMHSLLFVYPAKFVSSREGLSDFPPAAL
ncbi:uncharacterized protein LOC125905407 isoform X2 [Epinephelus fuscoguttatus]|uniref:uncharacterized protein LOC125905407 isoform X2 n=1 Tax=Epinephelus fuscoguttatus TaxID=293821 RepID=UPI0020D17C86|nr:uncharacterized protein LOC125905407 isoform X2 [Epinephelus fuscoguttatus]